MATQNTIPGRGFTEISIKPQRKDNNDEQK